MGATHLASGAALDLLCCDRNYLELADGQAVTEDPERVTCPDDVIYHGVYRETGGCIVLTETPAGEVTGMVSHVPHHSPTGMGWGYAGSGPADCARSLLIAALGPDKARCPECNGTQLVIFDQSAPTGSARPYNPAADGPRDLLDPERYGKCWTCTGGWAPLPYQAFKFEYVAKWPTSPGEWRMRRSAIRAWYAAAKGVA